MCGRRVPRAGGLLVVFLICLCRIPKHTAFINFLCCKNANNKCVLFYMMREDNDDLCGGFTERPGFCGW